MSEMIERVAEAIMRRRHGTGKPMHLTPEKSGGGILLPRTLQEENWAECLRDAAVAIPAMRQPTTDMVLAALAVHPKSIRLGACIVSAKYAAMIDEALK